MEDNVYSSHDIDNSNDRRWKIKQIFNTLDPREISFAIQSVREVKRNVIKKMVNLSNIYYDF